MNPIQPRCAKEPKPSKNDRTRMLRITRIRADFSSWMRSAHMEKTTERAEDTEINIVIREICEICVSGTFFRH